MIESIAVEPVTFVAFLNSFVLLKFVINNIAVFDVIVSNPPYVRELEKNEIHKNVKDFEPETALFVPDEDPLLFYKAIINFSEKRLLGNGRLYFEINQYFGRTD